MIRCEDCQAQMLDQIYGLLDADAERAFHEHLRDCPVCQPIWAKTQAMANLIAKAAKSEFPNVQFTAPASDPETTRTSHSTTIPTTTPASAKQPARRSSRFLALAVAACLAIAVGLPLGVRYNEYHEQSQLARESQNRLQVALAKQVELEQSLRDKQAAAEAEFLASQKAFNDLQQRWQAATVKLGDSLRRQPLTVSVAGPERIQPGAPNEYRIRTLNRQLLDTPAKVEVIIRDAKDQVVYRQPPTTTQEPLKLSLPISMWNDVAPGSDLFLDVMSIDEAGGKSPLCEKLNLAAPVYATHLVTDKPMYKPGETVYFRSLTLERSSFLPPPEELAVQFRITAPSGAEVYTEAGVTRINRNIAGIDSPVLGPDGEPLRGIASSEFAIPDDAPGGEYTLTVTRVAKYPGDPVTILDTRKFLVNQYVQDQLLKKLEFDAKTYGAGDPVQVKVDGLRNTGEPLANVPVSVQVNVGGEEIGIKAPATTDADGSVRLKFSLPKPLNTEDGTVSVTFRDAASVETISRPIPIVSKKLDIAFYPEGGELIAGVKNRVYFQVRTSRGKPADLDGTIVDGMETVAVARTLTDADHPGVNQGLGVFEITPKLGTRYSLKINRPIGIEGNFDLPAANAKGVVLTVPNGVSRGNEPIEATVQSPDKVRNLIIGAYARGRLIEQEPLTVKPGTPATVTFRPDSTASGVVRITVFEVTKLGDEKTGELPELTPIAERLVYRHPTQVINLNVQPNQPRYNPGSKAELSISATNETGAPTPAVLMVAVVQRSVLSMADDKTERFLPAHLFLASEVQNADQLEHANFIVGEHPLAAMTLDLLLGTQGWRRFAEVNPQRFQQQQGAVANRFLSSSGIQPQSAMLVSRREIAALEANYRPKLDVATAKLQANEDQQARLLQDDLQVQLQTLHNQVASQQLEAEQERQEQFAAWSELESTAGILTRVVGIGLVIGGLFYLLRRFLPSESTGGFRLGYAIGGVAVVGIVGVLSWAMIGSQAETSFSKATGAIDAPAPKMAREAMPEMAMGMAAGGEGGMAPFNGPGGVGGLGALGGMPAMGGAGMPMAPEAMAPMAMMDRGPGMPPRAAAMPAAPRLQEEAKNGEKAQADPAAKGPRRLEARGRVGELGFQRKQMADAKEMDQRDGPVDALALRNGRGLNPRANAFARGGIPGAPMPPPPGFPPGGRFAMEQADKPHGDLAGMGMGMGMGGRGPLAKREALNDLEENLARLQQEPQYRPFFVREYAHIAPEVMDNLRNDFTETVFWQPALVLDSQGHAKVSFQLASDIGQYRVLVAGHSLDGRIGAQVMEIEARKPFSVDPKLPVEVSANDRIDVPVRIINDSDDPRQLKMTFFPQGLKIDPQATASKTLKQDQQVWVDPLRLNANQRTRQLYRFTPDVANGKGTALLRLQGESIDPPAPADTIERKLRVMPEGFPISGSVSDQLEKSLQVELDLPPTWVPGSLFVEASVFPAPLAELQKGLEGLLQEPNGCFEQTSNSNYPNLMILDYLRSTDTASPETSRRARDLLDRGYGRLTSFECQLPSGDGRRGYEWFGGQAPPHEALTAFGLMQFLDMKRVMPVDDAMLKRTQQYLLDQRDGNGGFKRNPRALDAFGGAPQQITNAYIVWALTESERVLADSGKLPLDAEIAQLQATAKTSNDSYFLAVLANVLLNRGMNAEAAVILGQLTANQHADGYLDKAETSITQSSGRYLQIETTSLAILAWLKANDDKNYHQSVVKAAKWIGKQRDGGGTFGATQSTVLALKALVRYADATRRPAEAGTLSIELDGKVVASRDFTKDDRDTISLLITDSEKLLKPGKNLLTLNLTTKSGMPFSLSWSARSLKPASAEKLPIKLTTLLPKTDLTEGETVRLDVLVQNTQPKSTGMVTAIVGLPAGLKVPEDMKQLKRLTEIPKDGTAPRLSYFEIRGRELILYWRTMKADQVIEIPVDLIADLPGEYRGPASRAYLYYDADSKHWVDPLSVRISPAAAESAKDVAGK